MTSNNSRIAKNALALYVRMFFSMLVSLYTSRVVLNTLGVEDYGINNVVGGVVVMFALMNSTMSATVERFMSYEIGVKNLKKLNTIFNTSIYIHVGIAFIFFVLIETVGVWFLNSEMTIPDQRLEAANWVLHFSAFSTGINILSVPFRATVLSNERMGTFAKIGILEVLLRLLIVFMLTWFSVDKLKLFAVLTFIVSGLITLTYATISKLSFKECYFKWNWDKKVFKEMFAFAGWNLVGVSSTLARTQGINIVLNIFFGPTSNAARGIAYQVNGAVDKFVTNFLVALNPQITKSYASGNHTYLMNLVFNGSRYSFFLMLFLTCPIIIETDYVLTIWLKIVPDYAVIFVRLVLVLSMIEVLSKTLIQMMFATGKIRKYQIAVGSITTLNLPLSALFLHFGSPPQTVFIVAIVIAVAALFVRLVMLRTMTHLSISDYSNKVIFSVLLVSMLSVIMPLTLFFWMEPGFLRFLIICISSIMSVGLVTYKLGLSVNERLILKEKSKAFISKFFKK